MKMTCQRKEIKYPNHISINNSNDKKNAKSSLLDEVANANNAK